MIGLLICQRHVFFAGPLSSLAFMGLGINPRFSERLLITLENHRKFGHTILKEGFEAIYLLISEPDFYGGQFRFSQISVFHNNSLVGVGSLLVST